MSKETENRATRILLIRHGETEWNRSRRFQGRSDVPLNATGRKQARALAVALKGEVLNGIYSSPLERALETAKIIQTFHRETRLIVENGFIEMDLGRFDGMDAVRWAQQYPDFRKQWMRFPASVTMPAGEGLPEVQKRATAALKRVVEQHPWGSTLLVSSHNFVNLTLLCLALDISLNEFREVAQGTGALNVLHMNGTALGAERINDQSHLKNMEATP